MSQAPDTAVPKPTPTDVKAPIARPGILPRLLIASGVAGFAITLALLIAASRPSHADSGSVNAGRTAASDASHPNEPVTVESAPRWVGRRQAAWAADGTRTINFTLDAVNEVPMATRHARPQLVARCLSGSIDVYVVTGPLSVEGEAENHTVRVQVDGGPQESQQWTGSESGQELFSPDSVTLSDRLAHARLLRFGFTPFGAMPVTVDFAVDGFDQLAPLLTRTCGRHASTAAKKRS